MLSYLHHSDGAVYAGRMYVCLSIHVSFIKCTIMYCEHTAEPRSKHFCTHMYVDKVYSPANFLPNPQILDLYSKDQRFESNTMRSSYVKCARVFLSRAYYTIRQDVKECRASLSVNSCSS